MPTVADDLLIVGGHAIVACSRSSLTVVVFLFRELATLRVLLNQLGRGTRRRGIDESSIFQSARCRDAGLGDRVIID